jgi:hypothetical protein
VCQLFHLLAMGCGCRAVIEGMRDQISVVLAGLMSGRKLPRSGVLAVRGGSVGLAQELRHGLHASSMNGLSDLWAYILCVFLIILATGPRIHCVVSYIFCSN